MDGTSYYDYRGSKWSFKFHLSHSRQVNFIFSLSFNFLVYCGHKFLRQSLVWCYNQGMKAEHESRLIEKLNVASLIKTAAILNTLIYLLDPQTGVPLIPITVGLSAICLSTYYAMNHLVSKK